MNYYMHLEQQISTIYKQGNRFIQSVMLSLNSNLAIRKNRLN